MAHPILTRDVVAVIVSFQLGLGDFGIGTSETLSDVGADGLDCFEIISRCEERFDVTLSDDDVTLNSTVADIAGVISSKLRDKAKARNCVERARNGGSL